MIRWLHHCHFENLPGHLAEGRSGVRQSGGSMPSVRDSSSHWTIPSNSTSTAPVPRVPNCFDARLRNWLECGKLADRDQISTLKEVEGRIQYGDRDADDEELVAWWAKVQTSPVFSHHVHV